MTAPESDGESESEDINMNPNRGSPGRSVDHIEQFECLIHMFFGVLRNPCTSVKRIATYLMEEKGGYDTIDKSIKWMIRNPLYSLMLLFVTLMFLPFLMIAGVLVFSIALALTGIIVFEGTLLTFVSLISVGSLVALIIVLLIIAAVLLAIYMGFAHIYDIYGRGKITALSDFLKKETLDNHDRTDAHRGDSGIDSVGPT